MVIGRRKLNCSEKNPLSCTSATTDSTVSVPVLSRDLSSEPRQACYSFTFLPTPNVLRY
jgi:hypothetical protein